MNSIKAIIFDADGMIILKNKIFSLRYKEIYGITNEIMLPFFEGPFQKCLIGKADLKEEIKPYLKNGNGIKVLMSCYDFGLKQKEIWMKKSSI